jgi:protein-S-isoprenylcysteine O-methyltransferase Ste14
MLKLFAFFVLSALIVYVSRASLANPRSHGFYRFFVWECILALFLLAVDVWFRDPFSWHQIVSWFLLVICLLPLVFGVRSLISSGKPVRERAGDPSLLAFEKTSQLVTTGIYRYIRHPLYSSLLFLAWGIFFKSIHLAGFLLALLATAFLVATARADEAECASYFGPAYQAYKQRTRMFVPFLF